MRRLRFAAFLGRPAFPTRTASRPLGVLALAAVLAGSLLEASPAAGQTAQQQEVAPTTAARLELRLSALESEIRRLTGQVEELTYKLDQANARLERMEGGQGVAPNTAGAGGASASTLGSTSGLATATPSPAPIQPSNNSASNAGGVAPGPTTLGTVSQADLDAVRSGAASGGAQQQAALPASPAPNVALQGDTPQEQYNYAFGLLRQADYAQAEGALRSFLEAHPNDPLAGNAKYWLGETYYVRGDYQNAAIIFAEGFQQYPDSGKAPDNLLKLGMALGNLGATQDACGTFSELKKRYANAPANILQRAERERSRLGC